MMIPINLTEFLMMMAGVFTAIGGLGAVLIRQVDKRLEERFRAIEEARTEHNRSWTELFQSHITREEHEFESLRSLEREMMHFRADLPTLYLRRDEMRDYLIRLDMRFESLHDKLNHMTKSEDNNNDNQPL
jgi:hypothetical protein